MAPPVRFTEVQLEDFSGPHLLPPLLARVYAQGEALSSLWRDAAGNAFHLMALPPLRAANGGDNSAELMTAL